MLAELLKSALRHQGSLWAGAIAARGLASGDDAQTFVSVGIAVAIYAVTQGWSIMRKLTRRPQSVQSV